MSEENNIYILNPEYDLRLDKNRPILTNRQGGPLNESFIGVVHPVYAAMIALFDGQKELSVVEEEIEKLLMKDRDKIERIIKPLLENPEPLYFNFEGNGFNFPKKILIKRPVGPIPPVTNWKSFLIAKNELDMDTWRLHKPLDILFMVNTLCVTDCIYCYADRRERMDCRIPIKRLKELIREAGSLNMRSFDITGGEVFLYRHWEEFLGELIANGFKPYISTKMPISPGNIEKLKNIGIKQIQVSIDSIIEEELKEILRVGDDYYRNLMETLHYLDSSGFDIYTNTQVMSLNQSRISELLEFLLNLKNIKRINIGAAAFSLYRDEGVNKRLRLNLDTVKKIEASIEELKAKYEGKIQLNFSGYSSKKDIVDATIEEKKKNFGQRARCSANFYAIVILPDGKVTICEELYWHPRFIIGDLTKNSIEEVWNSEKAMGLYNLSRGHVREESLCRNCDAFSPCHRQRGVCWKEVLYAFGYDNWDYPDPKCPYAPPPSREYYIYE